MAEPNLGFLDAVNNFLPYLVAIVVAVVMLCVFVWYIKKYQPPICGVLTKCHHSVAPPAFIQDEMGRVRLYIGNKKLPEGLMWIKNRGWYEFLMPPDPNDPKDELGLESVETLGVEEVKRGRGRPPSKALVNEEVKIKKWSDMTQAEQEQYVLAYGKLLETPILDGLNKQVFFGSTASSTLTNLWAIAHAELPKVRLLSHAMHPKTQLDALATGNRLEGIKMASHDPIKWLIIAIIAAIPIAVTGIVAWLLTQHPEMLLVFFR